MQIKSRIEIIMTSEGAISFRLSGQMNRPIFNMMVETVRQDALERFREAESGNDGPKLVIPDIVPTVN